MGAPPLDQELGLAEIMHVSNIELAKRIIASGLGKAELEFVTSLTTPIFWMVSEAEGFGVSNGSAFFLDAGEGPIGVTAAHVVAGWRQDREARSAGPCRLGGRNSIIIDIEERLIDEHKDIDVATFNISAREVASLGKTVFAGSQKAWPPGPPQHERGLLIGGYPGKGTKLLRPNEVSFGAAPGGLIAHSISELDISCMFERALMIGILGAGLPPENFDFGGMSGGPMLTIIEQHGVRSWALAGVIYQGPNTATDETEAIKGLEIIKARGAHFILANGTLDKARWQSANIR